jgi:uncharacterized membrane protein YphA (DoxX/SURF4 family)
VLLPIAWVTCAVVIVTCALRVGRHPPARRTARQAMAVLYIGAGAAVNALFILRGDDYADFAKGSYIPYVRDTWASLVVPSHEVFIWVLVAFELAVGMLVMLGGQRTQLAYVAAIAFHIALLSFGWGFYVWSVPMLLAMGRLLRAERSAAS